LNEEALLELYRKFEHLRNCNKKKDKIDCLKEYQHDTLFTFVLEFLLNTHKKTGISDAKLKKNLIDKPYEPFTCLEALINYVIGNPTGKDNIVHSVQQYIELLPNFTLKRFITELITKKYKCGVTAKFVGEVLPNLIKVEHQVMLANKFKGDIKEPVQVSLKLDGVRCTILVNYDGSITFLSRQGKEIKGLKQIQSALKNKMLEGYVLDGELIKINVDNKPSEENFKETTSIVNSKESNKEGLEFVAFDIVPLDDYFKHECNLTYKQRFDLLVGKIGIGDGFIRIVPIYGVTDSIDVVYEKLNEVVGANQEGLMLNTLTGLY
jgi:hypothetical protein